MPGGRPRPREEGFDGVVALENFASGDSDAELAAFRDAFTGQDRPGKFSPTNLFPTTAGGGKVPIGSQRAAMSGVVHR